MMLINDVIMQQVEADEPNDILLFDPVGPPVSDTTSSQIEAPVKHHYRRIVETNRQQQKGSHGSFQGRRLLAADVGNDLKFTHGKNQVIRNRHQRF